MEVTVNQTDVFVRWHHALRDQTARVAIARRIERASHGNFGDCSAVGEGVSEMRIDVGAGYRVYFTRHHGEIVILLCGGDKKSQSADIRKARKMAAEL